MSSSTLAGEMTTTAPTSTTTSAETSGDLVEGFDTDSGAAESAGGPTDAAALPADAYLAVSNNLGLSTETGAGGDEAGGVGGAENTTFEEAAGWIDQRNEAGALGADEESAVDAGVVEVDSQEFFQFLAPLVGPLLNTLGPAAAKALSGTVAPALIQGLGSLFNRQRRPARASVPQRSRVRTAPTQQPAQEAGDGSEAVQLDEEAIAEAVDALEVVIGKDDRVQITNTREVPWKRIVQLTITAANGRTFLGSGALIGPRTIITAGHCVYMHTQGGFVRQIQCSPGRNGAQKPYGSMNASRVWTLRGWTTGRHRDCDVAAVILPRPFPAGDIGAFGFANLNDIELMSSRLNLAGYPGDKPLGTMWYHGRVAKSVTPTRIFYDIDTYGGQSGSPLWVKRPDGKRYMVGIHNIGSLTGNSAVRINKQVFELLKKWRNNPDG